ncbi:unnamed protein product [Cylindrotheca closterium]|uniref:t-SNARE coiled-coil homology domain-containing protein n=1 Tax=Cylindrotheca closterium TaxID=2856 RepID=A0AAD2G0U1_9STRA|nr:unnamed protein product [Cylindrotheca closterium]
MSISTTAPTAATTSKANNKNAIATEPPVRNSVSRSKELLSCAKTAWKIQQQQQQQQQNDPSTPPLMVPNLQLASLEEPPFSLVILEEGLTLLRAMDYGTQQLQKLVRRRGHTNDPTVEISQLVRQLEQDTEELTDFCKQLLVKYGRKRKQERKHWEFVVQWFQQVAAKYSKQLQECLKLRGEVLAEQAQQRRKLVDSSSSNNANGNNNTNTNKKKKKKNTSLATGASNRRANATPLFDSPLFQNNKKSLNNNATLRGKGVPSPPIQSGSGYGASNGGGGGGGGYINSNNTNGSRAGYGGGGYGGGFSAASGGYGSTGMRQRKSAAASSHYGNQQQQQQEVEEEEQKVQYQIQQRQQQRQTQQRLDEARQAETALGELGTLFSKMSNLIVQQGETLEKIEDDVEAAHADVMAGQDEIAKLYSIKKGNRPLIIKTFAILIFLIIFMRGYKN